MSHGHDPSLFINRELSWLAFNGRVLEEAIDPTTPLLERVKFVAIAAANLDEFFMVRVAGIMKDLEEGATAPDLAGMTPSQQLRAIVERTRGFVSKLYELTLGELLPALAAHGIRIVRIGDLNHSQRLSLSGYFRDAIFPILTPLAIDVSRPFPRLSSLSLNIALLLDPAPGETDRRIAIVQVPPGLPRLIPLTQSAGEFAFVLLADLIRANLAQLFPGQSIVEATVIRLVRDSEIELDDEGGRTHLELVEREVRRRRQSDVVRLEVEATASEELLALLRRQLDITPEEVFAAPGPLDLRFLMALVELPGFPELRDPPLKPVDVLADAQQADLFSVIDEHDVLLHHPYDSYDTVVALIAQAASDPGVLAIKMTLYRTSPGSPIIESLRQAADRNKQVTVLVELTARFDEERNIQWARALEEAGAHVIYGVRGYKTHAKICLIVRRSPRGLRRYVHLSTGNYNERTARIYTDFGLMTASSAVAEDATAFFSALTGYSDPPRLKKLIMAPTDFRRRLLKLIAREQRRAAAGQPAEILAKMNSLIDDEIIHALYVASQAGVAINLNVRGICALRPGLPGVSDNIRVVSIVDRFLEHSRIYYFHNGGDEDVYLASGDWMTRNLDKRIELMFPVNEAQHKVRLLYVLRAMFRDTEKARWLRPDGTYERRQAQPGEAAFRVQQHLQEESRRWASLDRDRAGVVFQPEEAG